MPLTEIQNKIARLLAKNRSPESYLAGGAAMHIEPQSKRYSNDLDYFHDSEERVAAAFAEDRGTLEGAGFDVRVTITQPGFVRALVSRDALITKVEWAHDTAWRLMPPIASEVSGYQLHPVDLAINRLLALVGRDEARDFWDTVETNRDTLSLGAMCWAAAGKDPGYTRPSCSPFCGAAASTGRRTSPDSCFWNRPTFTHSNKSGWPRSTPRRFSFLRAVQTKWVAFTTRSPNAVS